MKFITAIIFALLALFSVNANAISHPSISRAASAAATANTVTVGHASNAENAMDGAETYSTVESCAIMVAFVLVVFAIIALFGFICLRLVDTHDEQLLATASPQEAAYRLMFCSDRVQNRYRLKNSV